jgi:hypothetical protein
LGYFNMFILIVKGNASMEKIDHFKLISLY